MVDRLFRPTVIPIALLSVWPRWTHHVAKSSVVQSRRRCQVTSSHHDAVVAEHLGSDVEGVMSVRVDSSLLQPCDQKRASSHMDDSELDELVRIQIGATPIEQLQYAIPKTHVDHLDQKR